MLNGKYSKVLTIILIVSIIAVVGLLIYIGIGWFISYKNEVEAADAVEQFDSLYSTTSQQGTGGTSSQLPTTDEWGNDITIEDITDPSISGNESNGGSMNGGVTGTETGNGSGSSGNSNSSNGSGSSNGKVLTQNGYTVIGKIEIPKTNVKYVIYDSFVPDALEKSICFMWGVGLNKVGNSVLIGHNYKDNRYFGNNNKLQKGDKIYITDTQGQRISYTIDNKYITDSEDFSYSTRDTNGKRAISLSTCANNTQSRLIIWATED